MADPTSQRGTSTRPGVAVDGVETNSAEAAREERDGAGELLELVLEAHADRTAEEAAAVPEPIDGVVVGRLIGLSQGRPLVTFPDARRATPARAMAALAETDIGREVALMFEGADPNQPVILGLMHLDARSAQAREATLDDERLVFEAKREIELRCGNASITLQRDGKVVIRGEHLLSRANVTNEVQGGTVQIN